MLRSASIVAAIVAATVFIGSQMPARGADPVPVAIDPLTRPDIFSILRAPGQRPAAGYYPIGFVHGNPDRVAQFGVNLLQGLSSSSASFVHEKKFPTTTYDSDVNVANLGMSAYSMARPEEVLKSMLNAAGRKGATSVRTKAYGEIHGGITGAGKVFGVSVFDPATRQYLNHYVREHVRSRVADPRANNAIVMWGLDNEWEGNLDYSPQARAAFVPWLEKTYNGDISALNEAWGTRLVTFAEAASAPIPTAQEYKKNPGMFLDWHDFQTQGFVGLMSELVETMRQADPLHREVVHKATQQTVEMPMVNREKVMDNALFADMLRAKGSKLYGIDCYGNGDRETYEMNFLFNCIRGEDDAPGVGVYMGEANNHNGPGHQFASTWWRLLANGTKGVNFFTLGFAGAKDDWKNFGFLDADTGAPRDKLHYAARWTSMVHRTEKFWTEAVPMPGVTRVAMLLPRRDVLLSERSMRSVKPGTQPSRWAYPENHRWMVFRWLREQGYLVDVIPYSKLTDKNLTKFQGLFLIGADHLTAAETASVKTYVEQGGTLIADAAAGYYDQHHRARRQLESLLGVEMNVRAENADITMQSERRTYKARSNVSAKAVNAKMLSGKDTLLTFVNPIGKGKAIYLPFMLGSLELTHSANAIDGSGVVPADGPTADSEEYQSFAEEFAIGNWLKGKLAQVNLRPAYHWSDASTAPKVRVEVPQVDASGNAAIVISNRAQQSQETIPAATLDLHWPHSNSAAQGYWAPAEYDGLIPINVTVAAGRCKVQLPEVQTAGVLYLFRAHAPLLGIAQIASTDRGSDGNTAKVKPGVPLALSVDVVNTTDKALSSAMLNIMVPAGWRAERATIPVNLNVAEKTQIAVRVTPEFNLNVEKPHWFYPIVARLNHGGQDVAVISASVEVACDPQRVPHVLTGNKSLPKTYPYLTDTGATYEYIGGGKVSDPAKAGANTTANSALINGFGAARIGVQASGPNDAANFARFADAQADVVFDLKDTRDVMQVQLTPGPGHNRPYAMKVLLSDDNKSFRDVMSLTLPPETYAVSSPRISGKARYVRLQISWPETGGTLDEVVILGR